MLQNYITYQVKSIIQTGTKFFYTTMIKKVAPICVKILHFSNLQKKLLIVMVGVSKLKRQTST